MSTILITVFLILLIAGIPVSFALGVAAIVSLTIGGFDSVVFFHRMINSVSGFSLLAVPLYILAGNLCGETGITKRLVTLCTALVGHIPGGSGLVNVLASVFFGGISGSAVADTSAIGGMMIPAMKEEGYSGAFAGGITMASSTIGILIPPSIPQCLYGISVGVSIGSMFMAGVIPGLLVAGLQMFICSFISARRHYPKHQKATPGERLDALKSASWALGMPLIILLGCGLGIVTASEAGVIAVVYSTLIGVFVYRELDVKRLPRLIINSAITASVALYIVGVASVVSWVINVDDIPYRLSAFLLYAVRNKFMVLLIINIILFVVGCFMDLVPAMLLFAPIFLPVVRGWGISELQFGIMMSINLGIGLLTPPVGNCLFVASGISGSGMMSLFRESLPFALCNVACLVLVLAFPALTEWLPSIVMEW